ncbi:MAG: hypothetical protein FJY85_01105 [Deltaproteobacteria bacterium]|nr:hypothetical protein [Deltaproteobacteria bacterium]
MKSRNEMLEEENRRVRLLRISADLLVQSLMTQPMSLAEAESMIAGFRELALNLFPGKTQTLELIYMPRFRRALREAGLFDRKQTLHVVDAGEVP